MRASVVCGDVPLPIRNSQSWGWISWFSDVGFANQTLLCSRWTSADAAGFPILPLLLKADEASSGTIKHALRFTIPVEQRFAHSTCGRRDTLTAMVHRRVSAADGSISVSKASYRFPPTFNTQAKAILRAMTYGMYIADGGS